MTRRFFRVLIFLIIPALILSSCRFLEKEQEFNYMENYYGTLSGGVFYTDMTYQLDDKMKDVYEERVKAIDKFDEQTTNLLKSCDDLYESLVSLDEYCLTVMDSMNDDEVSNNQLKELTESIMTYKLSIESCMGRAYYYDSLEDTDEKVVATLRNQKFMEVTELAVTLDTYVMFLLSEQDDIAKLVQSYDSQAYTIYMEQMDKLINDVNPFLYGFISSYIDLATIYTYINSGDYYCASYSLEKMDTMLDSIDKSTDPHLMEVEKVYEHLQEEMSKPDVLRVGQVIQSKGILNSIVIQASAKEMDPNDKNALLLFYAAYSIAMLESEDDYGQPINQDAQLAEIVLLFILNAKVNKKNTDGNTATSTVLQDSKTSEDTKKSLDELNKLREYEKEKQELIDKAILGVNHMNFLYEDDTPKHYTQMVNALLYELNVHNGGLDEELLQGINLEFSNRLEELLGKNKDEFVDATNTATLEALMNEFSNWDGSTGDKNDKDTTKDVNETDEELSVEDLMYGSIETNYRVGIDNMQIPNIQTFYKPSGMCQGIIEGNLYYHLIMKDIYGALNERYANTKPNTHGFWMDDTDLLRFTGDLQDMIEKDYESLANWMSAQAKKPQENQWITTLNSMKITGRPQYVILAENEDSYEKGEVTHAVIAYKSSANKLYIMDPNYHNNDQLYLEMDYESFKMKSYKGSPSPEKKDVAYKYMFFVDSTILYDFSKLGAKFDVLEKGDYMKDTIPDYSLYELIKDSSGNDMKIPLTKTHDVSGKEIMIQLESNVFKGKLSVYNQDGNERAYVRLSDTTVVVNVEDKDQQLGLLIDQVMPEGLRWVDFQWITLVPSDMDKWNMVYQVTKILDFEMYSEAEQTALLSSVLEGVVYLQFMENKSLVIVHDQRSDMTFQLDYDGYRIKGTAESMADGDRLYQHFDMVIDENGEFSGTVVVGSSKSGDALLFDITWSPTNE